MATINGAIALGREKEIGDSAIDYFHMILGSLEVGKLADIAIVDLNPNEFYFPIMANPISHLIYTSR